jgi:hypothetical protein
MGTSKGRPKEAEVRAAARAAVRVEDRVEDIFDLVCFERTFVDEW